MKRTAVAAGVAALAVGLAGSPAGAAAVLEAHRHTFTTTSGARVTCDVHVFQSWLEGEATVYTELDDSPAACRASVVVVRWRYTDAAGAVHDGREFVYGGQKASATLQDVAGDLVSRHRVTLADCSADCTFGPYEFASFSSK